jgi:predicted nucleotidyltransferase
MKLTSKRIIQILESHGNEIKKYAVERIGLFGSFLKGTPKKSSDLDLLVSFKKASFDNYMELKFFLERIFHRKVDLIIENALKPALRYVKMEAIYARGI